jgi:hypothetical protein
MRDRKRDREKIVIYRERKRDRKKIERQKENREKKIHRSIKNKRKRGCEGKGGNREIYKEKSCIKRI